MTLIPASHSRLEWFRSGLLGGAGRGGPVRLVGIVSVIALAGRARVSFRPQRSFPAASQVAKMKPGNLLPGGLQGTPAQMLSSRRICRKRPTGRRKAQVLYAAHAELQSVQRPSADRSRHGASQASEPTIVKVDRHPAPAIVPEPSPAYTPPERLAPEQLNGARFERVASDNGAAEAPPRRERSPSATPEGDQRHAERLEFQAAADDGRAGTGGCEGRGRGSSGDRQGMGSGALLEKVLIPAGRGVYAHTIVAVDFDTNGPIVLEADTGPVAGDRMIGTFSKSGNDRLIVRVETVEHRGKPLEANGILVAPDQWRKRSRPVLISIISNVLSCQLRRRSFRDWERRLRWGTRPPPSARSEARRRLWASDRQAGSPDGRRRGGAGGRERDDRLDPEGSNGPSGGERFCRGDVPVERVEQIDRSIKGTDNATGGLVNRPPFSRRSGRAPPPSGLMISLWRLVR